MTPDPKAQMLANAMAVMRLRGLSLGEPVHVATDQVFTQVWEVTR